MDESGPKWSLPRRGLLARFAGFRFRIGVVGSRDAGPFHRQPPNRRFWAVSIWAEVFSATSVDSKKPRLYLAAAASASPALLMMVLVGGEIEPWRSPNPSELTVCNVFRSSPQMPPTPRKLLLTVNRSMVDSC